MVVSMKTPYKNRYVPPSPKLEQKKMPDNTNAVNTDDMIDETILLSNHMKSFVFVSTEEYKCFLMEFREKEFYTFDLARNDIYKTDSLFQYINTTTYCHTLVKMGITNKDFMDWLEGKITRLLES